MKSYKIQHDHLFAHPKLAYPESIPFDIAKTDKELARSIPIRLSCLLNDGDGNLLKHFLSLGKPLLIQDDLDLENNPRITDYKNLLVRAIVLQARDKGLPIYGK